MVICSTLLYCIVILYYGSPLYKVLHESLLIKPQQFNNRWLCSITTITSLQRSCLRHIRNTWNISTIKSQKTSSNFTTPYSKWFPHCSLPLNYRPATSGITHALLSVITEQPTDYLHRWRIAPLAIFNTICRSYTLQMNTLKQLHVSVCCPFLFTKKLMWSI